MTIRRAVATFLGPPGAALALAFSRHPELQDAAVVTLAYFAVPFWLLTVPWFVPGSRLRPHPLGLRARIALALAAPFVMYGFFWWGGAGFGAALLAVAVFRPADWRAPLVGEGAQRVPSRILLEVLLALMAALTAMGFVAAAGSLTARALLLYLAIANVAVACLVIGQRDPRLRLMAASAGAGLALGAGVSQLLTVGASFIPALVFWLLAAGELYRGARRREEATDAGTESGSGRNGSGGSDGCGFQPGLGGCSPGLRGGYSLRWWSDSGGCSRRGWCVTLATGHHMSTSHPLPLRT